MLARFARSHSAQHSPMALDAPQGCIARCVRAARAPRSLRSLAFWRNLDDFAKMALFSEIGISGRNADFSLKIAIFNENPRFSLKIRENLRFSRFSSKSMISTKILAHYVRSRSAQQALYLLCATSVPLRVTSHFDEIWTISSKWRFSTKIAKIVIFYENDDFSSKTTFSTKRARSLCSLAQRAAVLRYRCTLRARYARTSASLRSASHFQQNLGDFAENGDFLRKSPKIDIF